MYQRVLFISNWSINDGLTQATVLPNIALLASFKNIEEIILVTLERQPDYTVFQSDKVKHLPFNLFGKSSMKGYLDQLYTIPKQLKNIAKQHKTDVIIARGATAGNMAYLLCKKTRIPFYVESFEPHAMYMTHSGEWKNSGVKAKIQNRLETKQKRFARGLMVVARNYEKQLVAEGIAADNIHFCPCSANDSFVFNENKRNEIRASLQWEGKTVAVYLGKFGGMYMKEKAFDYFVRASKNIGANFRMLILSPGDKTAIESMWENRGGDANHLTVLKAKHNEVPYYLSAADFAFATYKEDASKQYLSPIKIAEYWACGLPVALPENIGDDSEIIWREGGGTVFTDVNFEKQLTAFISKLPTERTNSIEVELARKYRSYEHTKIVYTKLFNVS